MPDHADAAAARPLRASKGVHVDAVLGLSMTPTSVGLVLVEGQDADGATMDRDAFAVQDGAIRTSEQATAAVLRTEEFAATRGVRLHSIGVTWSEDADAQASMLMRSLSESGFDNVVAIRLPEATEALAHGIADVLGYETTAVCVIEPESVIALIVNTGDGAVQTAFNHAVESDDALISWLSAVFARADWAPEALVVVGSAGDFEHILPELEDTLSVPVFAPEEAKLALARGAALASAQNVDQPLDPYEVGHHDGDHYRHDDGVGRHRPLADRSRPSQVGPAAVLAAGVVTFVVSVSIAVSLQLSPDPESESAGPVAAVSVSDAPAAVQPVAPPPPAVVLPTPVAEVAPAALPEAPPVDAALGEPTPDQAPVFDEVPAAPDLPAAPAPVDSGPVDSADVPPPAAVPPPMSTPPTKKPGILTRIKDRLTPGDDGPPVVVAPAEPPPIP